MKKIFALIALSLMMSGCATKGIEVDRLTAAERSDYRATMRYAEVVDFVDAVARSPLAHKVSMGETEEGRDLPAVVIADPPVTSPEAAMASGKVRFFAFGGIHSGEACGKEALCMLARDIVEHPGARRNRKLLGGAVLLIAPLYNADANERVSPGNRTSQIGPELGMGERANVDGLDLNRDYMKLASAEGRSMVSFMTEWDPHVVFDSHTTNGSYHRYTLTYDGALNPAGETGPMAYTRHEMLPEASRRMEAETGYKSFYYGNFYNDMTRWRTYSHLPMFGAPYVGLRNRIAILSEAYAYATFEDRVLATLAFARACMEVAVDDRERIIELCARADERTVAKGRKGGDEMGIRFEIAKFEEPVVVEGYEMANAESDRRGVRQLPTDVEKDYKVEWWGRFEPTLTVERPLAYLIPPTHSHVVQKLREHGIETSPVGARLAVTVERFRVEGVERALRAYQNVRRVTLDVDSRKEWIAVGEGWTLARTAQPLGDLLVYLLEPQSDDGLARWDVVAPDIEEGEAWPVLRVVAFSE